MKRELGSRGRFARHPVIGSLWQLRLAEWLRGFACYEHSTHDGNLFKSALRRAMRRCLLALLVLLLIFAANILTAPSVDVPERPRHPEFRIEYPSWPFRFVVPTVDAIALPGRIYVRPERGQRERWLAHEYAHLLQWENHGAWKMLRRATADLWWLYVMRDYDRHDSIEQSANRALPRIYQYIPGNLPRDTTLRVVQCFPDWPDVICAREVSSL